MLSLVNEERHLEPSRVAVLWEADPETLQFSYVSREAESLVGYPAEEWLADPSFWASLIHPEDRANAVALCRDAVIDGEDHEFEYRMITRDSRVIQVRDLVRVVCEPCGRVTALRGAIVAVGDCAFSVPQQERMREVVHDLGNVLLTIVSQSTLALNLATDAEFRCALEAVAQAAKVANVLTNELSTLDQPIEETQVLIDVPATVRELQGWLSELLGPSVELQLMLNVATARVWLEEGQLQRVLLNLAINAREAMPRGGLCQIAVRRDWAEPVDAHRGMRGAVTLEVSDSGVGIPEHLIGSVFDRHVSTKCGRRTGLGLTTVARIVRDAGGTVAVQSHPGTGATFKITLPLA